MNIHRINSADVSAIYKKSRSNVSEVKSTGLMKKDGLDLSDSGKIFHAALKAVQDAPEVNEAKVKSVAKQIRENRYQVGSAEITDRILKGASFDRKA